MLPISLTVISLRVMSLTVMSLTVISLTVMSLKIWRDGIIQVTMNADYAKNGLTASALDPSISCVLVIETYK